MHPTAWRKILQQNNEPSLWPKSLRFDILTQLGLIQPSQLAKMVLSTVDENKAQCLLLGHWPKAAKGKGKATSPTISWFRHIVRAMQHVTNAVAPLEGIYSVMVQQRGTGAPTKANAQFSRKVCAIRISNGEVRLERRTGDTWTTVMQSRFETGHRNILIVAGTSTPTIPVQSRPRMRALGFSLQHVP